VRTEVKNEGYTSVTYSLIHRIRNDISSINYNKMSAEIKLVENIAKGVECYRTTQTRILAIN